MDIGLIIGVIVGLLTLSLIISGIIQKREQLAAEKRQKAAQHVYRARNAQEILHNLRGISINPEITTFILEYVTKNYQTAAALVPKLPNIQQDINRAILHQQGNKQKALTAIPLPADEQTLKITLAKLNKLQRYLKSLNQSRVVREDAYKRWSLELQTCCHHHEIGGLLKLASRAVDSVMPGTAKNYFEALKTKLTSSSLEESYRSQQTAALLSLEKNLKQAMHKKQQQEDELKEKEEGLPIGDKQSLFGEKKKW